MGEASHPGPSDSESDTVSLPGSESTARVSEAWEHADDPLHPPPIGFVVPPRAVLDEFDLRTVFQRKAVVMRLQSSEDHSGTLYALRWTKQLVALKFLMS